MSPATIDYRNIVCSHKNGVVIKCHVLPRSSLSKISGVHADAVKIKLTSPPIDGKANAECCTIVAKFFKITKAQVTIINGLSSRRKSLLLSGVTVDWVRDRLMGALSNLKFP